MASYGASASSSSTDPYAQFYYWDAAVNNWAFDYDAYYAAYGRTSASSVEVDNATYVAQALQQASAYGQADGRPKDAMGNAVAGTLKKGETRETVLRKNVGKIYEDQTLLEWDPSHKRLFVGDLGNDVSDAVLSQAFEKYPTFSKARVVRKKADNKSKGYGFVAFADPHDFLKAWKEMDGKYIGSRPCRLKKASEDVAPSTIGVRKDRLLAMNNKYDEFKAKNKMGGAIGGELRRHGVGKAWKDK
ncbi:hypothetical protein CBS101457_004017 [Exobasidium rhododendri]|nr:hypothetical protein CBS101457_004017 [Exobasidium rhododendri]